MINTASSTNFVAGSVFCTRCGDHVPAEASTVRFESGHLAVALTDPSQLCEACARGLYAFLREKGDERARREAERTATVPTREQLEAVHPRRFLAMLAARLRGEA